MFYNYGDNNFIAKGLFFVGALCIHVTVFFNCVHLHCFDCMPLYTAVFKKHTYAK